MNKILKDLVVKSRSMMGFDAPYILGYDCHGLPIELKVDRELGPKKRDMSVADFRRSCRAYATRFIDVMSVEFQRLGVFGDWDHLYLTMDFRYQAAIARALGKFVEQGLVLQGQEAGPLVHPLPDRARRSGSRVPRTTPRRRSTWSSGSLPRAPAISPAAFLPCLDLTSPFSSGRRHPGPSPRTSPSPFTPRWTTPRTRWTDAPSSWRSRWRRLSRR